jgi:tetratricopeptide (TPR) repeat protein
MKRCLISAAAVGWLAAGTMCWALDKIMLTKGPLLPGNVTGITAQEVQIEVKLRGEPATVKAVPVNEIKMISFDDDPPTLSKARAHIFKQEYEEAESALKDLKPEDKRPEIAADIEFYKALCAAQEALGGNGVLAEAAEAMQAFAKKYPTSYHYLEACELAGSLLVADRKYGQAEPYYAELAKAPWEDYKMRAGIGAGRAMLAQGKTAEALKAFDDVLGNTAAGDQAESQRVIAKLGRARCLAATNKTDEAIKTAQEIIAKTDANKSDLLAEAYNTLGTSLRKAGRTKDATLAFLHVDVLYDNSPDLHAEALANLSDLFSELHKPDHAGACLNKLKQRYPNSPWAAGR